MSCRIRKAIIIVACLVGSVVSARAAEPVTSEKTPPTSAFLPFDFYTRHRDQLGLSETQSREMDRIGKSLRESAQTLDEQRRTQTATLEKLVEQSPIDLEEAMKRFEAVLKAENELKALQFRNGILMRNTLRPEQLKQLQTLAARESASRGAGVRAEFAERIQRLRAEINKRTAGAPSEQVVEQIKQIEQAAKDGRLSEAKNQLEQVLREVRNESPASNEQTTDEARIAPGSQEKK